MILNQKEWIQGDQFLHGSKVLISNEETNLSGKQGWLTKEKIVGIENNIMVNQYYNRINQIL